MHPALPLLSPHFSRADKACSSSRSPPPQMLIISPHWCDCHSRQTVKAKTCNLLICITSFLRNKKLSVSKTANQSCTFSPNQALSTAFSVLCGITRWCNFTLLFSLIGVRLLEFAGGPLAKKTGPD